MSKIAEFVAANKVAVAAVAAGTVAVGGYVIYRKKKTADDAASKTSATTGGSGSGGSGSGSGKTMTDKGGYVPPSDLPGAKAGGGEIHDIIATPKSKGGVKLDKVSFGFTPVNPTQSFPASSADSYYVVAVYGDNAPSFAAGQTIADYMAKSPTPPFAYTQKGPFSYQDSNSVIQGLFTDSTPALALLVDANTQNIVDQFAPTSLDTGKNYQVATIYSGLQAPAATPGQSFWDYQKNTAPPPTYLVSLSDPMKNQDVQKAVTDAFQTWGVGAAAKLKPASVFVISAKDGSVVSQLFPDGENAWKGGDWKPPPPDRLYMTAVPTAHMVGDGIAFCALPGAVERPDGLCDVGYFVGNVSSSASGKSSYIGYNMQSARIDLNNLTNGFKFYESDLRGTGMSKPYLVFEYVPTSEVITHVYRVELPWPI